MADKIAINTVEELVAANLQENIIQIEYQIDKEFDYMTKKILNQALMKKTPEKCLAFPKMI